MNEDLEYQAKLAQEYISVTHCKECKFYAYSQHYQACLFHSSPKELCNIVQLDLKGELNNVSRSKV